MLNNKLNLLRKGFKFQLGVHVDLDLDSTSTVPLEWSFELGSKSGESLK